MRDVQAPVQVARSAGSERGAVDPRVSVVEGVVARYRDRPGTLALEWCGAAYVSLVLVFALGALLSAVPVLGWYLVAVSMSFGVAATGLGLYAAIRVGLVDRGARREALSGVLAVVLGTPLAVGAVWMLVRLAR
jgi:hypothetical protein